MWLAQLAATGAVGVEFASIFRRFGSEVTIIEMLDALIATEDADASRELAKQFGVIKKAPSGATNYTYARKAVAQLKASGADVNGLTERAGGWFEPVSDRGSWTGSPWRGPRSGG